MADELIVLRARRKSELRKAFRAIQHDPEYGPGTVVAFANWNEAHPHVDATLRGLVETGSVTEPVRDKFGRGYAVVQILDGPEGLGSEPGEVVDLARVPIDEQAAVIFTEDTSEPTASAEDRPEPPPQSGPGSGVEHWRQYAADTTRTEPSYWADKSRTEIIEALASQDIAV